MTNHSASFIPYFFAILCSIIGLKISAAQMIELPHLRSRRPDGKHTSAENLSRSDGRRLSQDKEFFPKRRKLLYRLKMNPIRTTQKKHIVHAVIPSA
jgi:hypothetical protein